MGAFCWKNCQKRRNEKKRIRQDAKTARVESRTARQLGKAQFGIDTTGRIAEAGFNVAGQIGRAFALKGSPVGMLGGLAGGNVSATATTGADQTKGFIPIVLAIGAVLFSLLSFGGLFSKKRRR